MQKIKSIISQYKFLVPVLMLAVLLSAFVFVLPTKTAKANPDTFCFSSSTTSTSTPNFMTPGTATTTIYASKGCADEMYGTKMYSLLNSFIASSSVTTYSIVQEFSQGSAGVNCIDTPNACDWYSATFNTVMNMSTSTIGATGLVDIAPVPAYIYDFASSTIGGLAGGQLGPTGGNNRSTKVLQFPALSRYSRWVVSLNIVANGNGAYHGAVIGKKEIGDR